MTTGCGSSPTRICVLDTTMVVPSCAGSLVMIDVGSVMSFDCGMDADDDDIPFNRKTRMIVIMSSMAVMLRKLTSPGPPFFRMALRSSVLYLTILRPLACGGDASAFIAALQRGRRGADPHPPANG